MKKTKELIRKRRNTGRTRPDESAIRLSGTLSKYRKGFGFLSCDKRSREIIGTDRDVYIAASDMASAMDGDTVTVELVSAGRRQSRSSRKTWVSNVSEKSGREYDFRNSRPVGRIVGIKKRKVTELAGTFQTVSHSGKRQISYIVPARKTISGEVIINENNTMGAVPGDKVAVQITVYPDRYSYAEGKVTEIISRAGEPGGDIRLIARSHGLTESFPPKAKAEARKLKKNQADDFRRSLQGRRDLRDEVIFTIDGEDARDFDDAVSVGVLNNGNYLLGVHIADVSHYVTDGSAIDSEAFKRGTSVYLQNQVIPMLPKALTTDICSLKPGEDRLALSVDIEINNLGRPVDHEIYESVICSSARLVYDDVSDLLEKVTSPISDGVEKEFYNSLDSCPSQEALITGNYPEIEKALFIMHDLALLLKEARRERGSIDFDLEESSITVNEDGVPVNITAAQRRSGNKMIEEFMLLANEVIAEHYRWLDIPFIFRVHEKPDNEKMARFKTFLQSFGIPFRSGTDSVHPKTLAAILEGIAGSSYENVINTVMLRSMQKAYYSTSCDGHFGLALDNYCHFTSPIRRYPDLLIHRIIKEQLRDGASGKNIEKYASLVSSAAETSSAAERKAIEAEREVEKLKKAEYMSGHIGEIHDGIISGIAGFGLFVQLDNTVEGLVRIEELCDDYYEYHPEEYMLLGTEKGHRYRIGDRVMVIVESVDIDRREINLLLN